jgi:hypothetical protein
VAVAVAAELLVYQFHHLHRIEVKNYRETKK